MLKQLFSKGSGKNACCLILTYTLTSWIFIPDAISHPRNYQVWPCSVYETWWQQPSRGRTCWWCFHCFPQITKPFFQIEKMLFERVSKKPPSNLANHYQHKQSSSAIRHSRTKEAHAVQYWQIAQHNLGQRKKEEIFFKRQGSSAYWTRALSAITWGKAL